LGGTTLIEIATNYYKNHLYNSLKVARKPLEPQKPGFCDFPIDYGDKYFEMLTAEEKRANGSFHCPSGRRNEALDCRVMSLCAADFYLEAKTLAFRAAAKKQGISEIDISKITHRFVLEKISNTVR
jgi:phage terminase large subunit GpA-like protein